jgi:hypothetical protein
MPAPLTRDGICHDGSVRIASDEDPVHVDAVQIGHSFHDVVEVRDAPAEDALRTADGRGIGDQVSLRLLVDTDV